MRVFLALGTNLGDRGANLLRARALLMKQDVQVVRQSEVRETKPLGGLPQPDYLNQVLECQTELLPDALLAVCKAVEAKMGRPLETKGKWESRIMDIDILLYGDQVVDTPTLKIPHPGLLERDFVVAGMRDLEP